MAAVDINGVDVIVPGSVEFVVNRAVSPFIEDTVHIAQPRIHKHLGAVGEVDGISAAAGIGFAAQGAVGGLGLRRGRNTDLL